MTTAHRPTFDPARGKEAQRGEAYHQRLQPAYKTLKFRQATQGTPTEQARRDLRAELLRNEQKHLAEKEGREYVESTTEEVLAIKGAQSPSSKRRLSDALEDESNDDPAGDATEPGDEDYQAKKRRVAEETGDIDADSVSSSSSSDSDSDSDDSDDLERELAKIRAERAEAAAKAAAEQAKKDEEQRERDIALGNPLLNPQKDYGVKRRWDDDVVFKNQARGTEERGKEKRFVNDLLRSDFHKRFMDKYVR